MTCAVPLAVLVAPGGARADADTVERAALARVIAQSYGRAKEPEGWAGDLLQALKDLRFDRSPENVCATVAVIGQESSFTVSPEVPRIGEIAETKALARLGEWNKEGMAFRLFSGTRTTFLAKIRAARSERDLDLAHRWVTQSLLDSFGVPFLLSAIERSRSLPEFFENRNEVKTLGSMQVAARFAIEAKTGKELSQLELADIYKVRDSLYTRYGGIYFGAMQLLGYRADYADKLSLFADYNAGRYSSRNAAIQWMAGRLSGQPLDLDGDLLAYVEGGAPRPGKTQAILWDILSKGDGKRSGLTEAQLHADLLLEKTYGFNRTDTYLTVRKLYQARFRAPPPYERIPQIDLRKHSIKITRGMTTEIFARSVHKRYEACLAALAPSAPVASNLKRPRGLPALGRRASAAPP